MVMSDQENWSAWMLVGDVARATGTTHDTVRAAAQGNITQVNGRYIITKRAVIDRETGIETHAMLYRFHDLGLPKPGDDDFFARWRHITGVSQDDLAIKMGISRPALSTSVEGKKHKPRLATLCKWARAVGIPRGEMLAWLEWYIYDKEGEVERRPMHPT